jgi:hypothetical protein
MLFDMQDYVNSGIIGPNQTPMTSQDWEDMMVTAEATLGAFNKSVFGYITYANIASSPCSDQLAELLQQRLDTYNEYYAQLQSFKQALMDDTATKDQYKAYSTAFDTYVESVRSIVAILDGDKFKITN